MKLAVTGDKGFIGTHFMNALKRDSRFDVRVLDRKKENLLEADSLKDFVSGRDCIIHLAAVNRGADAEYVAGNTVATHNLGYAAAKWNPTARIIYASSVKAEGDSVYGLSKKLGEAALEGFSKTQGLPVSILRITNIFGEGCRPFYNSVIATFCHQVARGEKLKVNPSREKFTFMYVGDLIAILMKEITAKKRPKFYFKKIYAGGEMSISELARVIGSFKHLKTGGKLSGAFRKKLFKTYQSHLQ